MDFYGHDSNIGPFTQAVFYPPRHIVWQSVNPTLGASRAIVKLAKMRSAVLHRRDWEELAVMDPLWAILSEPAKRFGKWDREDFFRTGAEEVSQLLGEGAKLGLPRARGRAIDFGCGIGRLTRALREHFAECHGVDISSSMIEMAGRLNPGCAFRQDATLASFPSGYADLIYSALVLQHQPDRATARRLIEEMLRVLAPGGLLVFQIPLSIPWRNRLQLRRRLYRTLHGLGLPHTFLYQRLKLCPIRMISIPLAEIQTIVGRQGGKVLRVDQTGIPGKEYVNGVVYCSRES